jgi:hypothetical protein
MAGIGTLSSHLCIIRQHIEIARFAYTHCFVCGVVLFLVVFAVQNIARGVILAEALVVCTRR